jgi:hypothetical protein
MDENAASSSLRELLIERQERESTAIKENSQWLNGSGNPVFLFKTPLVSTFGGSCTAALTAPLILKGVSLSALRSKCL